MTTLPASARSQRALCARDSSTGGLSASNMGTWRSSVSSRAGMAVRASSDRKAGQVSRTTSGSTAAKIITAADRPNSATTMVTSRDPAANTAMYRPSTMPKTRASTSLRTARWRNVRLAMSMTVRPVPPTIISSGARPLTAG